MRTIIDTNLKENNMKNSNNIKRTKAIIFDMDNTLVRSFIDFPLMKAEVERILNNGGIKGDTAIPVATLLQSLKDNPLYTRELDHKLWQRILEIELAGMENAVREEGIDEVLDKLKEYAYLVVITNNHFESAIKALDHAGIKDYFHLILGRGLLPALKPSPLGFEYMLESLPDIKTSDCISIGDASIDLEATNGIGMRFLAYTGSRKEDWSRFLKKPIYYLDKWDDKAVEVITALLCK